jgi:hypothetical protein
VFAGPARVGDDVDDPPAAYVDEQTGVAIDHTISQQIVVGVARDSQTVSLLPALTRDFHMIPDSVRDLA